MRKLPCLALLAVCYCINVEALWSAEPLTRLSDLRALSMDEAGNGRQVSVEGTVLGLEPSAPFHFFIHDGTAGCFTKTRPGGRPGSLKAGDRVRINGVSDALGYYPSVKDASVTVVGIGMPPQPARPQPGEMFAPGLDSEWVEVPATVTGFDLGDDRLTLTVEVYGQTFKAEMPMFPGAGKRAADLVQRPVLLRGVLGTIFNSQRQMTDRHFFVPSLDSVIPTTPHADGGNSPLLEVARLLTAGYGPETPVKVRGIVTQQESQGFHMRDGSGSTLVHTGVADRLETGTLVEIEGFGVVSPFRPTLRATRVTRLGMENVRPLPLDPDTADLSGMILTGHRPHCNSPVACSATQGWKPAARCGISARRCWRKKGFPPPCKPSRRERLPRAPGSRCKLPANPGVSRPEWSSISCGSPRKRPPIPSNIPVPPPSGLLLPFCIMKTRLILRRLALAALLSFPFHFVTAGDDPVDFT
jgi:hypothetical protein